MKAIEDLKPRLEAFARNCVLHGDMTPMAQRMLQQILDEHIPSSQGCKR